MESVLSQPELLRLILDGIPERESCCVRQLCRSVRNAYDRTLERLAVRDYVPEAYRSSVPARTGAGRTPLAQSVRNFSQRGCRPAEVAFDLRPGGGGYDRFGKPLQPSPLSLIQALSSGAGGALPSTALELPVHMLSANVARAVAAAFPHVTELRLTGVGVSYHLAPETVGGLEALLGSRRVNLEKKRRERRRGGGDGGRGGVPGGGGRGESVGGGGGGGDRSAPYGGAASGSAGAGPSAAAGAQAAASCQPTQHDPQPRPGLLTSLMCLQLLNMEFIPTQLLSLAFGNTRLTSLTINYHCRSWTKLEIEALSSLTQLTSLGFPCQNVVLVSVLQPLTRLTRLRIFDNYTVLPTRIFAPLTNLTDLDLGSMQLLAADLTCLGALTRLRARALLPYAAAALWRGSDPDHSDDEPWVLDESGMDFLFRDAPQPPPLGAAAAPALAGGNAPPLLEQQLDEELFPPMVMPAPPTAGATWPLPPQLRELVLWDKQQSVEVLGGLLPPAGGGMEPAGVRLGRELTAGRSHATSGRFGGGRRGHGGSGECVELQLPLCRLRHASPCGALLPAAEEALVGAIGTLARWLPPDRSGGAAGVGTAGAAWHGRSLTIFYDRKKDTRDPDAGAWGGFGMRRRYGNAAAEAARLLRPVGYTYSHYDPTSGLSHGRWLGALGALGLSRLCLRGVRLSHGDLQTAAAALLNLQELCLLSYTTYPLEDLPCLAALTRLRTLRLDARCWADEEYRDASETHGSGAVTEALVALYIGGSGLGGPSGAGATAAVAHGGAVAAAPVASAYPGGYGGVVEMEVSRVVLMKYEQEGVRELSHRQRLVETARDVARRVERRVAAAAGAGRSTLRVVDKRFERYSIVSEDDAQGGW